MRDSRSVRNWWGMDTADMFIAVLGGMITRFSEFIRFPEL